MTLAASTLAHTATLVVVGPSSRLTDAVRTLAEIDAAGGLRTVLIPSTPGETVAADLEIADAVAIAGLKPQHLDNAIAAQRLSSLPTLVWWRGGPESRLDGVASLADRVILDVEDTAALWRRAPDLFERSAITDIRWARLTRWRAALAHFFDLARVRDAAPAIARLSVGGRDRALCTLLAGWLDASLGWQGRVAVDLTDGEADAPLSDVRVTGEGLDLRLALLSTGTCVNTTAQIDGQVLASRIVSLGEQGLAAFLSQELRVRSRDLAFERAVRATAVLGF
jgi:glucose-6-phosphate dehydrogenase assembly protein OpcA